MNGSSANRGIRGKESSDKYHLVSASSIDAPFQIIHVSVPEPATKQRFRKDIDALHQGALALKRPLSDAIIFPILAWMALRGRTFKGWRASHFTVRELLKDLRGYDQRLREKEVYLRLRRLEELGWVRGPEVGSTWEILIPSERPVVSFYLPVSAKMKLVRVRINLCIDVTSMEELKGLPLD